MKLESLVITYQNDVVNTFPGLVHTPVTSRKWFVLEVAIPTARRIAPKV